MKKIILFAIVSASLLAYVSCDKIEEPYFEKIQVVVVDTIPEFPAVTNYTKIVFVEDYTGHKCGNCPRAHETLEDLKTEFGNQIISMAAHVGFFADTTTSYPYDFRTPAGNELNNFYKNADIGLPNGLINRTVFNDKIVIAHEDWRDAILNQLETPPTAYLQIINEYAEENREAIIYVKTSFLEAIDQNLSLVIYIIEDHIISDQTDYQAVPQHIEEYDHRHVLRDAVVGAWGIPFITSPLAADTDSIKAYSYILPAEFNVDNCYTIALLTNSENKQILQAAEAHIKE